MMMMMGKKKKKRGCGLELGFRTHQLVRMRMRMR